MMVRTAWRYFILDLDSGDVFSLSQKLADRFIREQNVAFPLFAGKRIGFGSVRLLLDEARDVVGIQDISGSKIALDSRGRRDDQQFTDNLQAVMNVAFRSPHDTDRSTEAQFDERRAKASRFSGSWKDDPELFTTMEAIFVYRSKHPHFKGKAPAVRTSN